MKNNTKLIMETWRRFLNEEDAMDRDDPMSGKAPLPNEPPFEDDMPLSGDKDLEVSFDPETQSGPDDFEGNVASIRELIEEYQEMSDEELLNLKYTQEEIDEARAGMPGSMKDMNPGSRELSDEEYRGLSMDDPSEDDYYGHDF